MRDTWQETTLGDIAEVVGGGTPSTTKSEYWDGDIVWLTPTEVTALDGKTISESKRMITDSGLRNSGARILPRGTVVLTSRASIGFVAIAGTELTTNQGFQSLVPSDAVDKHFLMYWIQLNRSEFESRSAGSTFKEISKTNVKSMQIALPSIAEQKRIVDVVTSIDHYINALEQQIVTVLLAKSSLLEDQLGQEFAGAKQVKLGDVLEISRGGSPRPIQSYLTDSNDGLNWIKIGDASNSTKYIYETKQKIKREGLAKTRQVFPGDFLLSNSMSFGRPYIMRTEGCIHDGWLLLGNVSKHFDEDFLYNLLRSSLIQAKFSSQAAGSGVKNLNIDIVSDVEITLPSIPDQRKIAELLNSFDAQELALEDLLSKALAMRNALLGDLLSGNHEIPKSYDSFLEAV
jgi:type I restriction enzyme S subunit